MVTHVPPPSPSLSSASLSTITGSLNPHPRRASSRTPAQTPSISSSRYAPSSYRPPLSTHAPATLPPSPPLSHSHASSPPSSYVAPGFSNNYGRSSYTTPKPVPSQVGSRATESSRRSRHRGNAASQAESKYQPRRASAQTQPAPSSSGTGSLHERLNEFPWYGQSGDVEILLTTRSGRQDRKYRLHNLILKQNSIWFARALRDIPSFANSNMDTGERQGNSSQLESRGPRARSAFSARSSRRRSERNMTSSSMGEPLRLVSHFELDWRDTSANDGFPVLVLKTAATSDHSATRSWPTHAHSPASSTSFFRSIIGRRSSSRSSRQSSDSSVAYPAPLSTNLIPADTDEDDWDILAAYASLFAIMYNHAPCLDAHSLPNAYMQSKTLLRLAALYSALPIVRPRAEHHLLQFNRSLHRNIARYPPSYLRLGHLLQSQAIFGEALVHVAGLWPTHERLLAEVDDRVKDLIEDKHDELLELRNKVDGRLFRISLSTSRGERVGPGNAFVDWMAVCLFRQWLADGTTEVAKKGILKTPTSVERRSSRAAKSDDGVKLGLAIPGRPYRLMAEGGEAYLSRAQIKEFLKQQAPREMYSREALKQLERRIDEIKAQARNQVRGVCRSFLEGDGEYEYLTCTKVEDRDFNWVWQR